MVALGSQFPGKSRFTAEVLTASHIWEVRYKLGPVSDDVGSNVGRVRVDFRQECVPKIFPPGCPHFRPDFAPEHITTFRLFVSPILSLTLFLKKFAPKYD